MYMTNSIISFKCCLWITSKYLLPPVTIYSTLLTPSPVDMSMDSPSPTHLNCINICNNNIFNTRASSDTFDKTQLMNNIKHPGQAVKIVAIPNGTIIKANDDEVCETQTEKALKSSKSCTSFDKLDARWSLQGSKSTDDIKGYKSCDENLIKFIFTKHGIQVISDVETIV